MIYIMSPHSDQSLGLVNVLRTAGYQEAIVAVLAPNEPNSTCSRYDQTITTLELQSEQGDHTVVPTTARTTEHVLLSADCRVGDIVLARSSLSVYDKIWLLAAAIEANVPVPATWQSPMDIPKDQFPVFYKEKRERGAGMRGVAHCSTDLPPNPPREMIYQEYLSSQGTYGVSFLADRGNILVSNSHHERESYPPSGGSAIFIEGCDNPVLLNHTERLVAQIEYSGWGLAEFKYNPVSDDFVLMEINAKLWASCEFSFRSEPLFMELLFGLLPGERQGECHGRRSTVFINRALRRGPFYCLARAGHIMRSTRVVYPGWFRDALVGLIPRRCDGTLRRLADRLSLFRFVRPYREVPVLESRNTSGLETK